MENSGLVIEKNFDIDIISSYAELSLKPFIYDSVSTLDIPILHQHALPILLNLKNAMIFSPPATGKSLLLSIALHQLINLRYKGLQFLIIEQMEHLVKETYENLLHFSFESNIKYCVCDKTTKVKEDFKPFSDCQVAILSTYKCKSLLKFAHRSYEKVRFVVLDAFDPSFGQCLKAAYLIKEKVPNAIFWVFNKMSNEIARIEQFYMSYLVDPFMIKVVKTHGDIREHSYSYVLTQNTWEKLDYLKKILEMNQKCQKIIFFNRTDPRNIMTEIVDYRPVLLNGKTERSDIIQEFNKNIFKVLVVEATQFFARKIKNCRSLYVIIFDIVNNDVLEVLSRRSGSGTADRLFIFVQGNDEIEKVNEISEFFRVPINQWPSPNDL